MNICICEQHLPMKTLLYETGLDLKFSAIVLFTLVCVDAFNNENACLAV